jgi:L-cysteine/cystine lyase
VTHEQARELFPVLRRYAYLNAGAFGPLPEPAARVMREQLEEDVEIGRGRAPYFEAMLATRLRLREQIAELLGTTHEHVALTSSTTDGCNIVLAGLGLTPEDEIVTTDAEHFGLAGPVFASGAGVRVARVQERPAADALDLIVAEITPRTRLVALSHVLWTTGHVIDVRALRAQIEVPLLVDGAQSVGSMPVTVGDVDFYTVSGQKWLCGPESTGALYVRDVDALRVARPGYFAQESFEPGGKYVARAGAQRLDPGWVSVAGMNGLLVSLALAPEWRYERIRELASRCRDSLLGGGLNVVTEGQQAGLVSFVPRGDAVETAARALERGVVIRSLPTTGWVRASCGWWNDEHDIERLAKAVT